MGEAIEYRVIYILGTGHCGSTLLDLLLGAHPQATSCGELLMLGRYLRHGWGCTCGQGRSLWGCPRWGRVLACLKTQVELEGLDLECFSSWRRILRLPAAERARYAQAYSAVSRALYACLARASGTPWLVDSSKSPQRLYFLRRGGVEDLWVIHLVRDGRAVLNSYMRKYGRGYAWRAFRRWASVNASGLALRRLFPRERWLPLSYERLALDPEGTLRTICAFLGWDFEPAMLRLQEREGPWERGAHLIDGNSVRGPIRLDERWRQELSRQERLLFTLATGLLNRVFADD